MKLANIIKKNFKSNNVLKIWLVSFFIIPLFMFAMKLAWKTDTDIFVFTWLFLILGSMVAQLFINLFGKVKSGKFQYLFILIVMNITMFLTYVLKYHTSWINDIEQILPKMQWVGELLASIVISAILFVIKTLVWVTLMLKWKQLVQNDKKRIDLEDRNIVLEKEHKELKEKYELEIQAKAAKEMEQEVTDEFSIPGLGLGPEQMVLDEFIPPVPKEKPKEIIPLIIEPEEDKPEDERHIPLNVHDEDKLL